MRTKDFYFDLPESLIAQYPLPNRQDSRLLIYDKHEQTIQHDQFKNLVDFLKPNDLLVFNNSKVIKARLFAKKVTGGKIELLVERVLSPSTFLAHIRASHPPKPGSELLITDEIRIVVEEKANHLYRCSTKHSVYSSAKSIHQILEQHGHIPLPPYIQRSDELEDMARYQTVYAEAEGSVAAPTAGLHFDEALLEQLSKSNIQKGFVTLHVGSGTFQPVRTESIFDHHMHSEWMCLESALVEQIKSTKMKGGRVIAVGTTALRALESASQSGTIQPYEGDTSIFIYPGYAFKTVDGLITNFHLPESTLLMLVSAFIGYEPMLKVYQSAVEDGYRFFSYGDVSLLL